MRQMLSALSFAVSKPIPSIAMQPNNDSNAVSEKAIGSDKAMMRFVSMYFLYLTAIILSVAKDPLQC